MQCVAAQPQFIGTSFGQWSLLVDAKKIGESSNKALLFALISFLEPEYPMELSFALLLTVESVCKFCLWPEALDNRHASHGGI